MKHYKINFTGQQIKIRTLLLISLSISFLINLNRFLFIVSPSLAYFNDVEAGSVLVFLFRLLGFAAYCLVLLYITVYSTKYLLRFSKSIRVLIFIIIIIIFSIVAFHLILWIHHLVLFKVIEPEREGIRYVWVVMGITTVLIGWLIVFQQKQRINELEREQLIKENIQNELLALKSQINPHFLFNSLNSLNYIIRNFPEEATDFVDRLSLIFRYILQSRDKNLISLKDEIDFLNNYMHLAAIRYGTNVKIAMNIAIEYHFILIPILSLQILLENAIKHNEVSKEYPLTIKIYIENEYLIFENKIQPRNNPEESTGYGLTNLSKRYILLKEKDIEVYKNDHFIVKLPLS